jgi:hypothetical protein
MLKTKKITKEIETTITEEITCNVCGWVSKNKTEDPNFNWPGGRFCPMFYYPSEYDDLIYEIHICDPCWKRFLEACVIKPEEE